MSVTGRPETLRILLTGATGAMGSRVAERLLERGHRVTATTSAPDGLRPLRSLCAQATLLDSLDAVAVGEVVARAEPDVIVHRHTHTSGRPSGLDHLLSAAHAAGVGRFVAQSCTGAIKLRRGVQVNSEQRALEAAVLEAPLQGVVLRYGTVYGPALSGFLAELVRRRRLPIVGDGRGVWSWVHIDDAAAATVAAIERGGRGTYDVVDDEPAAAAEWLPYLAAVLGARKPRKVPMWLGRLLVGEEVTRRMTEDLGASNARARRDLDWRPAWASWRDGFPLAFEPCRLGRAGGVTAGGSRPS